MHRKFIALIISAAIAVTGISLVAKPARADETTRILAGIAALALIGAAIRNSRESSVQVTTTATPTWQPPMPKYRHPLPPPPTPKVSRFVVPQYCLLPTPRYGANDTLVGEKCLRRYYGRTAQLPGQCRTTFWNGRRWRTGYDPTCLRGKGYVIRR